MIPSTISAFEGNSPSEAAENLREAHLRILTQRAGRYAKRTENAEAEEQIRLLFFSHGPSDYAIPLDDLREVRVLRSFCPIPGARKVVPGIFYYRGEVLSLHDLSSFMGVTYTEEPRWVLIVEKDRQRLGLMARDVLDVREVGTSSVRPPPITLGDRAICVQGVVNQTTLLLRTEALFNTASFFKGL